MVRGEVVLDAGAGGWRVSSVLVCARLLGVIGASATSEAWHRPQLDRLDEMTTTPRGFSIAILWIGT